MTAPATPAAMPGAKCAHFESNGAYRCDKKAAHPGNHTMRRARLSDAMAIVEQLLDQPPESAVAVNGFHPGSDVTAAPRPPHDRSVTQDAAAALEVASKIARFTAMRWVLTTEERRAAALLHDAIVARVGSVPLAAGELAPTTDPSDS